MENIDRVLEGAVKGGNLEKVKALLSAGADPNFRVKWNNDTLLHCVYSAEIAKELLSHGARLNALNKWQEDPLNSAITQGKNEELVRELLKHGARVNSSDRRGNTPLNLAVTKTCKNLEVIKLLLEYGADINHEGLRYENSVITALDGAMYDPKCAKLLIKFTLLKKFREDYQKIINLDVYQRFNHYSELKKYLEDCVCEVLQMKTDTIRDDFSLYELVTDKLEGIVKCKNQISLKLATIDYSERYPLYNDVIMEKIKPFLKRADLLKKLSETKVYTKLDISNQEANVTEIILDPDCTYYLSENLSEDDLLSFITAFDSSNHCATSSSRSSNYSEVQDESLDDSSPSNDVKHARLE